MENILRFYGRRKGKGIVGIRETLMKEWLPSFVPQVTEKEGLKLEFGVKTKKIFLEVGFGGGEHIAELAKMDKTSGFLGAEPFLNGVASLLAHLNGSHRSGTGGLSLEEGRVDNIRIWPDDIRLLFPKMKDKLFDGIYVLYPDPWPKKRHAQRRFINNENIPELHRLLKKNGCVFVATDVQDYAEWALERMNESGIFEQVNKDVHKAPLDWVPTRYELKGVAAGRVPTYLIFRKK